MRPRAGRPGAVSRARCTPRTDGRSRAAETRARRPRAPTIRAPIRGPRPLSALPPRDRGYATEPREDQRVCEPRGVAPSVALSLHLTTVPGTGHVPTRQGDFQGFCDFL